MAGTDIFSRARTLTLAGILAFAGAAAGQDGETNITEKQPAEAEVQQTQAQKLAQVADLAETGRQEESATIMIAAAELLATVAVDTDRSAALADAGETEPTEGADEADDSKTTDEDHDLTVDGLLDEATEFAQGDETLLDLIADTRQRLDSESSFGATLGRTGGALRNYYTVYGNHRWWLTTRFKGGTLAEVGIRGDGDTDLDLYIYDENGNLIVKNENWTDRAYVSWTPRWTGNFKIVVVNRGSVWNRFLLLTN